MKNLPPQTSNEFNKQAAIATTLAIKLGVRKMGKDTQLKYELMIKDQKRMRTKLEERLNAQRGETVRVLALDILNERVNKQHPALRPRHLSSENRAQQRKAAEHDAKAITLRAEESEYAEFDKACLAEQEQFFGREKLKEACHPSPPSPANDNQRSLSQEFNERGGLSL